MAGHNPKKFKRHEFPGRKKQGKTHMHGCKGDGKVPCPGKHRVECDGLILHKERCPPCSDKATERTLFGTTKADLTS